MNSNDAFMVNGGDSGARNLSDEQKKAVEKKFGELNGSAEPDPGKKAQSFQLDITPEMNDYLLRFYNNFKSIMKKYVVGSGASILYCLSVIALIYGISGIFCPIFERHDNLQVKLSCVSALSAYELALFGVLCLLIMLKKSLNDAVSIVLYAALFMVGTGIGMDSLTNDNRHVALLAGFIGIAVAIVKIFLMEKKLSMDFGKYLLGGMMIFLVWNFFTSPIMAYVLSDDPAIKIVLRNVWLGGWIIMLAAGIFMLIGAIRTADGAELARDKDRRFVLSRRMAWIFALMLILSGIGHQIALAYVFEFDYTFGDFIPLIILFTILQIELLRIYGKKTGILEIMVSLIPLGVIGITAAEKAFITDYSFSPGFLWNPPVLLLVGGLSFGALFLMHGRAKFAWVSAPYLIFFLISIASSVRVPGVTNTYLFFGALAVILLTAGLYFKQVWLVLAGYTIGVIGIGEVPQITKELTSLGLSFPASGFLLWGAGLIGFALYFRDKFPLLISVIAAFTAMAANFYEGDSFWYLLISSIVFTVLAAAYWKLCGNRWVVFLLGVPLLRGIFYLLCKLGYWDFVMLAFVLLGIGAMVSVFSRNGNGNGKLNGKENGTPVIPKKSFLNPNAAEIAVMVFIMSFVAFAIVPSASCGRKKACAISCTSNLKQIGLALRMYSQEYKGEYPPYDGAKGLEVLRANGFLENVRMYTCPMTSDWQKAKDGCEIKEESCSYVYKAGLNENSPVDKALAWDKPGNHKNYGNILFNDGHAAGFYGKNWMENIK